MYGTMFNYCGYNLNYTPTDNANCCVPEYLFQLYRNNQETNRRCQYSPVDQVEFFDGSIETGFYFVTTTNYFPLKGNGWYNDYVVDKSIQHGLIQHDDIQYQLKPSKIIAKDNFTLFVNNVYDKYDYRIREAKKSINGFIGLLGKTHTKQVQTYFDTNVEDVWDEIIKTDEVKVKGIYGSICNAKPIDILNCSDADFDAVMTEETPLIYQISKEQGIPLHENTLPIHRKIYDKANMDMYELHLKIKELNPMAVFVGIKTDCLVYNKIKIHPRLSEEWGGVKKCEVPDIKACVINQESKLRTETYELTNVD
eukprot:6479623-Amphidinium_carterae.1